MCICCSSGRAGFAIIEFPKPKLSDFCSTGCWPCRIGFGMSLNYSYRRAAALIDRMKTAERMRLEHLCRRIQEAEEMLNAAAAELLQNCGDLCQGICCRNLHMDAVIDLADFVYILAQDATLRDTISRCLQHEEAFYTSNCPFLEGGVGPCVFPGHLRPEVCITSFCRGDASIRTEIGCVRKCFRTLERSIFLKRWTGRFIVW